MCAGILGIDNFRDSLASAAHNETEAAVERSGREPGAGQPIVADLRYVDQGRADCASGDNTTPKRTDDSL